MSDAESKVKAIKFEVGKLYKTRNGEVRRIVCIDVPGRFPVVSVRTNEKDSNSCFSHGATGGILENGGSHNWDLIAEHREAREWHLQACACGTGASTPFIRAYGSDIGKDEIIRVREVLDHD